MPRNEEQTVTDNLGVFKAIASVMTDIGAVGISKNRNNQQQGYKFRGIDDVYNELNSLLSKHNLLMLPNVVSREQVERTTAKGSPIFYTNVMVEFTLVCALDGSATSIRTVGEAMDSGDKSSNKALSAAYKYAAMMLFCIPTEGDNDADATTHEPAARPKLTTVNGEKATPHAQSRAPYAEIQDGIRDIIKNGTIEDLQFWYKSNEATIKGFSAAWNAEIVAEFASAKDDIRAKGGA